CCVLFTLSLYVCELWEMRQNAGIMRLAGRVGLVLRGPIAVWLMAQFAAEVAAAEAWIALAAPAGSWMGAGANHAPLYAIFEPTPEDFSATLAVDVFVGYTWMALLIYGASKADVINRYFKADNSAVEELTDRMAKIASSQSRNPVPKDYFIMLGLAFGA